MIRSHTGKLALILCLSFISLAACVSPQALQPAEATAIISPAVTTAVPSPQPSATPAQPTATATLKPPTPSPTAACAQASGEWREDALPHEDGYWDMPFKLYLPPCYGQDPEQEYPLLILLHGSNGNKEQWPSLNLAETMDDLIAGGMPPFLIASPTIYNIEGDIFAVSGQIAKKLPAYIAEHYQFTPGRQVQALGGLSYGAIWTLRTATLHPEAFAKLGLHSLTGDSPLMVSFSQAMLKLDEKDRPQIFMDTGEFDEYRWSPQTLDKILTNDGIAHKWLYQPGYHSPAYWQENLPIYLEFYAQGW